MEYTIRGIVERVEEAQTFGTFTKREFVLLYNDGKYDQLVKLETHGDRTGILDPIRTRDEVVASFDIRGREHNGRVYTNLVAWKVEPIGNENAQEGTYAGAEEANGDESVSTPVQPDLDGNSNDDDIPF